MAFGSNPPGYSQHTPTMMQPHQAAFAPYNFTQQNANSVPSAPDYSTPSQAHGVRTYSSIHDVNSDEDSDADKF